MKKSILILFLALFVFGLNQAYSQIVLDPTPLDPTCIDLENPLTPVAGNPYTYEVNVPTPPGAKSFRWYVTQDENFATGGVYNFATAQAIGGPILAAGDAHYDILTPDADAITLTWQSFSLAAGEYVFVVIYVENQQTNPPDPTNCLTNNLKVYRIQPLHAFTLDIANVDSAANVVGPPTMPTCVDNVQNATFDVSFGTDGGVVYDFGQNIFYYVVTGANYSIGYQLSAIFSGLQGPTGAGALGQTATLYWDYTFAGLAANPNPVSLTEATETIIGVVEAQGGAVGEAGQMIYLKVIIQHNSFEAAANADDYDYSLAIDGVLVGPDPFPPLAYPDYADLHYATCDPDTFVNDVTVQRLIARPTIEAVDPNYLPIAP